MSVPCKECNDRYIACHDHCDRYKAWKQEFDVVKERAIKHYMTEKMLDERRNRAIVRMKRMKSKN